MLNRVNRRVNAINPAALKKLSLLPCVPVNRQTRVLFSVQSICGCPSVGVSTQWLKNYLSEINITWHEYVLSAS